MARRPPYVSRYSGIDAYLLQRVPATAAAVVLTFAEVTAMLRLPAPLSAVTLAEHFETAHARQHWRLLGFAVTLDWVARQVVFTRLAGEAE